MREFKKCVKLIWYNMVDDVVVFFKEKKNIIVFMGVGIFILFGIFDFCLVGMGFYSKFVYLGLNDL